MDRRKFITTCTSCAVASMGAMFLNDARINSQIYDTKDFVMNRIEVHLAEHCNLNCKYCGNFSSIADKEFYDLDKFKQDIKRISYLLNKKLTELPLTGGEPLLNPEINKYIKISREYFPDTCILVNTNGVLLDSMDENFWKTCADNEISIMPSVYPIKINWASIINKAKKYNVKIQVHKFRQAGQEVTAENIDEYTITTFAKRALVEKGSGTDNTTCITRFLCNNLHNGKLYPCPYIAYIRHLNKKYNFNFKVTEDDYLDIYKIKSAKDIMKFTKTPILPFCRYCGKITKNLKWENDPLHNESEWI